MDYHTLPRRQLQMLCKKHGIPANAANSEMADALTVLLKPKQQLPANSSKQPEKRATRSREPTLSETVSKSKDVEESSNLKLPKATNSHKIQEEESNTKPKRATRGQGSACTVLEAPKSAALKEKTPMNDDTESNSAAKQQETKRVSTRNGASKQRNTEMPTNAAENVDSKAVSPKSDKKKEKTGGIVLRRGRVKVRSPGNLSKSPESEKIVKEVALTTEEKAIRMTCSQSCLVDAKKTRKNKRSVTFSAVLEVNSACVEHPSKDVEESAEETMAEILQGAGPNLSTNTNSACIAKKVVGTRKASRTVSTKDCVQDMAADQVDHQKSSKEPVTKVSKAEGLHVAFDAEKTANIEIGGESDRKKSVRGKKISNSVGAAAAKENEEEKVADGFVKGAHFEDIPCTRRSRRLTIVPTDVKSNQDMQLATEAAAKENEEEKIADGFIKGVHCEDIPCTRRSRRSTIVPTDVKSNQDMQLATEQLKGQSKDHHQTNSIAPNKNEGALPAETSRRSRRKTLAPIELNHVQSNVGSASEKMEKRVSKAKDTQSKGYKSVLKDESLEAQQKHSEIKTCDSTPIASKAEVQPIETKEALSVGNLHGSRQKALVACTYQHSTPTEKVSNEMGFQNIGTTEIISRKVEKNVDATESEKADSQAPLSNTFSEPHSLQEVSNNAKVEVETVKKTSVMPRSTRKSSKVSPTHPDNGAAVSQESAFNTQSDIVDEAVGKNIQDSEDLHVITQASIEQSQDILVLVNTNEPRVEDPVNDTPSNDDINHSDRFSSAFQIVTGKGEGQGQINSQDAKPISCNEECEYNKCTIDVRSSSTTATHRPTCVSETANSSPLVDKLDAADVKCHEFTEETLTATSSEYEQQVLEITNGIDHIVSEQEGHAMDELATIISLTEDINEKSRRYSPVSIMIQDNGSLEGNHHMKGNDLENSIDIHTDEGITGSSPAAFVESTVEHQNPLDMATAEKESCTHLLTSDTDKIANMTSSEAADVVEQDPNQAVHSSLCEEDAIDKENIKIQGDLQLQDTNEGLPSDGVKSVEDISTTDDQLGQLSPLLPSCSAEPGIPLPRESACKTKQRCPRSIFKSARKGKFFVPWENRSLEENAAPPSNKEDSLNSLDYAEKDAAIWGLNSHEMSCDEVDSASSEEEESSAETEETLTDTEVCNFNTEVLISNTEGDYSCSEDDAPSDFEEDTMFDSEDEFSEMEGELLSGEESYESEELDTSEEEFSESEDDVGEDFQEYEASPVPQSVTNSESFDALYTTHGLEDQQMAIIAPSKLSPANNGITNGCAPDVDPTNIDEKIGGQHEESPKTLSTHAVTELQENVDVQMSYCDKTAMERVRSTDSTCQDSDSLTSLSSLFATPPTRVKEDVQCSLEPPSYNDNTAMERVQSTDSTCQDSESLTSLSSLFATPPSRVKEDVKCPPDSPSHNDNTAMEKVQSTDTTCQDSDTLTSLSSLFATPPPRVKEDVKCSLAPPSIGILQSKQSGTLETQPNILLESGQEESMELCPPCELSHEDVIAEVEQHTMDGAKHGTELCESMGGVDKELEINDQMVELLETCSVENSLAEPAVVDCFLVSPMLDNMQKSQLPESNSKNAFVSGNEDKQIHTSASESMCLGPSEFILEGNRAEMGDPDICEEVIQILNVSPNTDNLEVQEEPGNFKIIQDAIEEDEAGNVEVKNDLENNEISVAMDFDAQNDSENLSELLDLGEGSTSELTEELMITAVVSTPLAVNDNSNESETAAEPDLQILHLDSHLRVEDLPQKQNNEDVLAFDIAYSASSTTDSVVSLESAKGLEVDMVSGDDKINLFSSDTPCNLLEEGEPLLQLECVQDLMPSDASEQEKTEAIREEPEVIQSESNAEILVSQVIASNTFEVDHCSTPKCSTDSGIVQVFNHESLDEVTQTLKCVEIESVNAQVEEVHEKPLDESQSSEESNEDMETAAAHNLISKEQSMKQIDLTLLSVRKLRHMCKGNQMSAKKKTENETPARKPWMSATKQVHQPNTSMHPRDLPSGNKRSVLQALSSNVKAAPSAAMQTPTAKVLQRPRNLMGTYDGNEGTGKHLVTPSPQAPMSSKRDFARSHHR